MTPSLAASEIAANVQGVRERIRRAAGMSGRDPSSVHLIAVSKTHDAQAVLNAVEAGQFLFGENRVQEAAMKFPEIKSRYPGVTLHLIGRLQSNKAKDAMALFDTIHTLDRESLAETIARESQKAGRCPDLFVQVNTGEEPQKSGISPVDALAFAERCRSFWKLPVKGLMCIPPVDENPAPHFALLLKLAREAGLKELSMGMSADYEIAVTLGATYIRVGSAIFGERQPNSA